MFLPEIVCVRQNIPCSPELAGQEVQTSRLVRNILGFTNIELLMALPQKKLVNALQGILAYS